MTEERVLAVYIRGVKIYVVLQLGGPGLRIDVGPVITTAADEGGLADGIRQGLEIEVSDEQREMPNLRTYRSPVLSAAGVDSISKFEKGLTYITFRKTPERIEIQPYRCAPGGRGFQAHGKPRELPTNTSMLEIARAILRLAQE